MLKLIQTREGRSEIASTRRYCNAEMETDFHMRNYLEKHLDKSSVWLGSSVLFWLVILRLGVLWELLSHSYVINWEGHWGVSDVITVGCWDVNNALISSNVLFFFPVVWVFHANQAKYIKAVQQMVGVSLTPIYQICFSLPLFFSMVWRHTCTHMLHLLNFTAVLTTFFFFVFFSVKNSPGPLGIRNALI